MAHVPSSIRPYHNGILAVQLFRVEPLNFYLDSNLRCSFVSRYKGTQKSCRANICFARTIPHFIKHRLEHPRKVIFQPTDQPR